MANYLYSLENLIDAVIKVAPYARWRILDGILSWLESRIHNYSFSYAYSFYRGLGYSVNEAMGVPDLEFEPVSEILEEWYRCFIDRHIDDRIRNQVELAVRGENVALINVHNQKASGYERPKLSPRFSL